MRSASVWLRIQTTPPFIPPLQTPQVENLIPKITNLFAMVTSHSLSLSSRLCAAPVSYPYALRHRRWARPPSTLCAMHRARAARAAPTIVPVDTSGLKNVLQIWMVSVLTSSCRFEHNLRAV